MSELALPKIDNSILNRKSEIVKNLSKLTDKENVLSEADELRPYETDALSVYLSLIHISEPTRPY